MRPTGTALQRVDLLIGLALVAALGGSLLGVVTYEDARLATFEVSWATTGIEYGTEPASATGAGEIELALEVDAANLTGGEVEVTVGGQAARLQPVAIHVEIAVPGVNETFATDGELAAGPTSSTTLTVPVALRDAPDVATIEAPSPEAARAQLAAQHASTNGTGTWTIRVTLAPTAPGPLGAEAFTVDARASLATYAAEVLVDTPEVDPR